MSRTKHKLGPLTSWNVTGLASRAADDVRQSEEEAEDDQHDRLVQPWLFLTTPNHIDTQTD